MNFSFLSTDVNSEFEQRLKLISESVAARRSNYPIWHGQIAPNISEMSNNPYYLVRLFEPFIDSMLKVLSNGEPSWEERWSKILESQTVYENRFILKVLIAIQYIPYFARFPAYQDSFNFINENLVNSWYGVIKLIIDKQPENFQYLASSIDYSSILQMPDKISSSFNYKLAVEIFTINSASILKLTSDESYKLLVNNTSSKATIILNPENLKNASQIDFLKIAAQLIDLAKQRINICHLFEIEFKEVASSVGKRLFQIIESPSDLINFIEKFKIIYLELKKLGSIFYLNFDQNQNSILASRDIATCNEAKESALNGLAKLLNSDPSKNTYNEILEYVVANVKPWELKEYLDNLSPQTDFSAEIRQLFRSLKYRNKCFLDIEEKAPQTQVCVEYVIKNIGTIEPRTIISNLKDKFVINPGIIDSILEELYLFNSDVSKEQVSKESLISELRVQKKMLDGGSKRTYSQMVNSERLNSLEKFTHGL